MAARRWPWGVALIWLLLAAAAGCDSGGDGTSPFRNLGKRGDSSVAANPARPAGTDRR